MSYEKMTLVWVQGEYNYDVDVEATADGIEIEWLGTISWEWVLDAILYRLTIAESIRDDSLVWKQMQRDNAAIRNETAANRSGI